MKYEVELPEEIGDRLAAKASECGQDVVHLIRVAVGRFVEEEGPTENGAKWSDEMERRRRDLIDKDIAGSITADEHTELMRLDRLANEHFDRIAPPPMEGVRRLHEQLLKRRGHKN